MRSNRGVDVSQLDQVADDLGKAGPKVAAAAYAAVKKGATSIKDDAAGRAARIGPHVRHYPRTINYDIVPFKALMGAIEAEIGPGPEYRGRGMQRGLGNVLEYGTSKNPPHPHLGPALDAEAPKFLAALGEAGEQALE